MAKKRGRPKKPFDVERGLRVCNAIANGATLRQVAENESIDNSTIFYWQRTNEDFAQQYALAMADRADNDFEKLADEIAVPPRMCENKAGQLCVDNGWANWQRTRIDTLKWMICHRLPKKYSDKLQLSGDSDNPAVMEIRYIGGNPDASKE